MRILIAAAGSRGDIAPYTGLGARLRGAGHDVALAATEEFAPLARACGAEFRRLPGRARGDALGRRELLRSAVDFITELGQGFADAVTPDTDLLLLSATTAPLGWHLTEATGVPSVGVYLQPTAPTGDFPPTVTATRSLSRPGNRLAGRLALRMADRVYGPAVTALRRRLELPARTPAATRRRQERAHWPVLHGFSTALVPRPSDWRPGLEIVGTWWPHVDTARLPTEVEDFLAAGPPPVFVGFGSMAAGHGERLGALAVRALRAAGLRGVLQSGSAQLAADGDDVLTVGDVPHELLFPRTAAVVHHAGAGTAAAGLRAGVPAVPVPVSADQPFWAARLAALGAATAPLPFASLTAEALADAVDRAVRRPEHARSAGAVARRLATEDGAGRVVGFLTERFG
ncbi:glycosyltransferase [Streptomyces sp. A012304]|uniref:glycosyltransferase n=1 Tax=Streptomyces sp. A012304 TaxID=375446 RepID=UPI0022306515|nr:glycosyltransferase [Streptomyces sp. A012304]GKQ35015.1 glycosyl transferase [Streptomyces sp. A012304]